MADYFCGYTLKTLKWLMYSSKNHSKANNGGSITNIIEICEHPDWKKKITHLFSMHNGRNPLLNDRLFEELKDNTKAESGKVDAFLKTGCTMYSWGGIESIVQVPSRFTILKFCHDLLNRYGSVPMISFDFL